MLVVEKMSSLMLLSKCRRDEVDVVGKIVEASRVQSDTSMDVCVWEMKYRKSELRLYSGGCRKTRPPSCMSRGALSLSMANVHGRV